MKTKPPADEEKNTARTYDLVLEYLKGQILEGKPYPIKALLGFGMNLLMFPGT